MMKRVFGVLAGMVVMAAVVFAATDSYMTANFFIVRESKANGSSAVTIGVPDLAASYSLTLPVDDGTSGQVLTTDGNGVLSWSTAATVPSSGIVTSNGTALSSTTTSSGIAAQLSDETGSGALVFATSPALVTPNIGTPSAATLTNATGLPVSTGISGLGSGIATFLATPTSANLAAALTNETGSGAAVFGTSPTLTTPNNSITDSATSATTDMETFDHASSGTPAAGFGDAMLFNASSATVASRNQARIQSRWTTATDASRASALDLQTVTGAGSLTTRFTLFGDGDAEFGATTGNAYIDSTPTSASTVTYGFVGDNGTGMYRGGSAELDFATGGNKALTIDVNGDTEFNVTTGNAHIDSTAGSATTPTYGFVGDSGLGMYRSGTDILNFATADTSRMQINASGVVAIANLTTNGPVVTSGGNGTLTVPSATLGVVNGGTGDATLTSHGVLIGAGTSAVAATAVGATNTVLHGNTGADPTYSAVSLTADVTGQLPGANGGSDDWIACTTPTTSSGTVNITWGTGPTFTCKYRRTNDTMHWRLFASLGTGGSVTNTLYINVPDSLTIDTTKTTRTTNAHLGTGIAYDNSANTNFYHQCYQDAGNNRIRCTSNGTLQEWDATHPMTWAVDDQIIYDLFIPISGW